MDRTTHRYAALSLAVIAMACARSRTNEVGISDSATATTAVRSDSTVATTTRTDTSRGDTAMTTRTDTSMRRDTSAMHTDTTRSSAAGEVSLGSGSATDASVARLISAVDRAEIEEARLVLSKTQNSDLRSFAQQMIDDHTASMSVVDSVARGSMSSNTTSTMSDTTHRDSSAMSSTTPNGGLDAAIAQLESEHQKSMDALRSMSGSDLDKKYVQGQVDDHQTVLTLLRQYASNVNNSTLKSHVSSFTTTVSEHLEKARNLQRTISNE